MARLVFSAGTGQAVNTESLVIRKVRLIAGSANATAVLYGNGVAISYLAALTGTADNDPATSGGNVFEGIPAAGPITLDVVGTGAHVTIDF